MADRIIKVVEGRTIVVGGTDLLGPLVTSAVEAAAASATAVAGLESTLAAFTTPGTATAGRPAGVALVAGTAINAQCCFLLDAVQQAGKVVSVDLFDRAAGTGNIAAYRTIGGTRTRIGLSTVTTTGSGTQKTLALSSSISVLAGDILCFQTSNAVIPYSDGADGAGLFLGAAGAPPATVTLGSATTIKLQLRYNIAYAVQVVTATAFTAMQQSVATAEANASAAAGSTALLNEQAMITLGRPSGITLVAATAINGQACYFLDPVAKAGQLVSVDLFDRAAGTGNIAVYRNVSGTQTRVGLATVTATGAGAQRTLPLSAALQVQVGDILCFQTFAAILPYSDGAEGAGLYLGAGAAPPATVTLGASTAIKLQLRFNISYAVQVVTAASFAALRQSLLASGSAPIAFEAAVRPISLGSAGWQHFLVYGQSLATGIGSQPALSAAQPFANLTFGGGVRAGKAGSSSGALNTSPGTTTVKALVEENASGGAPAADGGTNSGETICTGATSMANEIAATEQGLSPSSLVFFASAPGHTGYGIAQLAKGSGWYQHLLDHVVEAKARATTAGKSYACHAIGWMQGESDAQADTPTYKASLKQLAADLDADIRAITGQTAPARLLTYQTAGSNGTATLARVAAVRQAQFEAVAESPLILFAGPIAHLAAAGDQIHLTNVSELRFAKTMGRALKQLLVEGREPDCIWPASATARGTKLTVRFRVPRFPLVLDAATFGAITDLGWRVQDDTGTLTISAIAVSSSGDAVTMTLSRALAANPRVRHALDYQSSTTSFTLSPSGCLRDSTEGETTIFGATYPLWHVAPAFQLPIIALPGA